MGGGGRVRDVGAGAEAWVEQAGLGEVVEGSAVFGEVLGLGADAVVPVEAEPGQVVDQGGGVFGAAAGGVDVLDAEEEAAFGLAGLGPGEEGGVGAAEVERAGRAGGESRGDGEWRWHGAA